MDSFFKTWVKDGIPELLNHRKFHFVGIGGAGMSALAHIGKELGFTVSGSDLVASKYTELLENAGIKVTIGHDSKNVPVDCDVLVYSTAVPRTNPELLEAEKRGITIVSRGDLLAAILECKRGIAVAGAHGKTTTTSMLSLVLETAGLDPSVIIGGELNDIGGNAKLGRGDYLVTEADESDGSFLKLHPEVAVVTNIDNDHLDYYSSVSNIRSAFLQFLSGLNDGFGVVCVDNGRIRELVDDLPCRFITYGLTGGDVSAQNIHCLPLSSRADVYYQNSRLGALNLEVPGAHNVQNALAAVACGLGLGIDFAAICRGLSKFKGVQRRFQVMGKVDGVTVVDDYAHHPTEIGATLDAARTLGARRIVVVFQPHRYTRTKLLYRELAQSLSAADSVIITDIYPAGEVPIDGISGKLIYNELAGRFNDGLHYLDEEDVIPFLKRVIRSGDLVMTIGAGSVWKIGQQLIWQLTKENVKKGSQVTLDTEVG